MKVIGIIPARHGSTRFPGKPLKPILGKPLIQWVAEQAQEAKLIDEIFVATDNDKIAKCVEEIGIKVIMTPENLATGTDRVCFVAKNIESDVVLNIQGDEPLISGNLLDQLVQPFMIEKKLEMATLGKSINKEELLSKNTAKIILNIKNEAIYFSRYPIPYSRHELDQDDEYKGCLKHIGIYAYSKDFLIRFCHQPPTLIEQLEGLEQLRALYLGARIKVIQVEHESWGVDVPEDIYKIEKIIQSRLCLKN